MEKFLKQSQMLEKDTLSFIEECIETDGIDKRWASIARTHIEEGFMALRRAAYLLGSRPDLHVSKEGST